MDNDNDKDAGIVTSTATEDALQSTPSGAQANEGEHHSCERVRQSPVEMHPDGAPCIGCARRIQLGEHGETSQSQQLLVNGMTAVERCVVDNVSDRVPLMVRVRSSRSGHGSRIIVHHTTNGMMRTSWRI